MYEITLMGAFYITLQASNKGNSMPLEGPHQFKCVNTVTSKCAQDARHMQIAQLMYDVHCMLCARMKYFRSTTKFQFYLLELMGKCTKID